MNNNTNIYILGHSKMFENFNFDLVCRGKYSDDTISYI